MIKKKVGARINLLPRPLPLALVLRSMGAPLHCHLSYTDAKINKISIMSYKEKVK